MKKSIDRRQFVLGSSSVLAAAALLGVTGCSSSGGTEGGTPPDGAAGDAPAGGGAAGDGAADISQACYGQETPGLATLEESVSYNQIVSEESEKSDAPSISQDTVPYLHTNDYGKSVDLKVEILTPSTAVAGETPLIVWINGGGFTSSDPAKSLDTRLAFAKAGYVVASVQHRTSATANFPGPLQDVKAAIRFLKANADAYKFDPNKVAVGGNSSGGYYASMIGVTGNVKTIPWPNM